MRRVSGRTGEGSGVGEVAEGRVGAGGAAGWVGGGGIGLRGRSGGGSLCTVGVMRAAGWCGALDAGWWMRGRRGGGDCGMMVVGDRWG